MRNKQSNPGQGNNSTGSGTTGHDTANTISTLEQYQNIVNDLSAETLVKALQSVSKFLNHVTPEDMNDRLFEVFTIYLASDEYAIYDRLERSDFTLIWKELKDLEKGLRPLNDQIKKLELNN